MTGWLAGMPRCYAAALVNTFLLGSKQLPECLRRFSYVYSRRRQQQHALLSSSLLKLPGLAPFLKFNVAAPSSASVLFGLLESRFGRQREQRCEAAGFEARPLRHRG